MATVLRGDDNFDTAEAIAGTAKAWVRYNAISNAIVDSYNVSSVTDNGGGFITVAFTTPMSTANYVTVGMTGNLAVGGGYAMAISMYSQTTTQVQLVCGYATSSASGATDRDYNSIIVFGA